MKKLFTTLLLLGAVAGTQAQVTVTAYDADTKTVTINYNRAAGLSTEDMVAKAIKDALEGPNATIVNLGGPAQRKAAVATIKLTGDWENRDTDKDGAKTIKKIVDEFGDANAPDTLDLSACKKFCSEFISVKDVINGTEMGPTQTCPGYETDQHVTTFTANYKLPDETVTGTANLTTKYYYPWNDEFTGTPVQHADGNWYDGPENWAQKLTPKTVVTDANNGNVMNVDSYTDNGDGTCTYSLTITHDDKKFLINKEYNLACIVFPTSDKFTFIPDEQFIGAQKLKKVVLSEKMVAIGNDAFSGLTGFEEINFPASLREIGKEAFMGSGIKVAELAVCTQLKRLRYETFEDAKNLATVTFPSSLIEIQNDCFQRTGITKADMSECHLLRVIAQKAFSTCPSLTEVRVCSHPKKIKGGEGSGAFNNSTAIRTVEVVGCKDAPNITQCVCENNAFSPDITYVQTQVENVETKGARLIFPQDMFWDMPMKSGAGQTGNEYMGYASCFDFFVGDYKEGVAISKQSNVEAYFKFAPRGEHANAVDDLTGTSNDAFCASDEEMRSRNGIGNGWHEFMHVGEAIVIHDEADFLRTYSRTEGSGAVLLRPELGITAYRAVDYISKPYQYIQNNMGDLIFIGDPNNAADLANPDNYLTKKECTERGISIKGKPRYFYATPGGTLYLRPLRPLRVSNGEYVQSYSYIPENTGVVLYSKKLAQDVFLIMSPYTGTEYDLTSEKAKYPHTGLYRFEKERKAAGGTIGQMDDNGKAIDDPENLNDNINLLQGSYGVDTGVAPVYPWTYQDPEKFYKGTYDPTHIDYRNFGFNKSQNKWLRLQPGIMRYNRAFAMIPASRFNNNNENSGQMPDFTLDDMPVGTEGSSNTFILIGSEFEDEMTDGIQTISTSTQTYDKDAWYTLQGVRVDNPTKGVYIHNNKKVVIK